MTRCVPEGRLGYGVADAPQTKGHQTMKILFLVHPTYLLSLAGGLWSKSSSSSLPDGGEGTRPITKTEKKENTAKLLLALKAVQEWRVSHPLTFHWPMRHKWVQLISSGMKKILAMCPGKERELKHL